MAEHPALSRADALARVAALRPAAYARTRNAIDGAVTGLSPCISHGLVSMTEVLAGVAARHPLPVGHKFVFELGWRAYFRHVWQHRGEGILQSLHDGPLPDRAYARELPEDIRQGRTGLPVIDQAVRSLHATGWLHNHARMWLASHVVHQRRVHWRCGADWLYGHLLDGDLASNHLSWQWVAGTGSHKPYLFNAENVARHAPPDWHCPGSLIDTDYETLDRMARQPEPPPWPGAPRRNDSPAPDEHAPEPPLLAGPPAELGFTAPDGRDLAGREVWLVHPWNLGELPVGLAPGTRVIALAVADFHRQWPWSGRRWRFVGQRMAELASHRWHGDATAIGAALQAAARVRSVDEPHLRSWLPRWAECAAAPALFPAVDRRCDSFSQWWPRATRGLSTAADLLACQEEPAW